MPRSCPESIRNPHPWEALEIIATLIGHRAGSRDIASLKTAILKSYRYMQLALDECLAVQPELAAAKPMRTRAEGTIAAA